MSRQDSDRREDFDDVFSFEEALERDVEIEPPSE
jgi:hypothetical protein